MSFCSYTNSSLNSRTDSPNFLLIWNSPFGFFDIFFFYKLSTNCCSFSGGSNNDFSPLCSNSSTFGVSSGWKQPRLSLGWRETAQQRHDRNQWRYYKLCFLQSHYQLKNYFLMGNIWINLLNKYWWFITRSKIWSIPHTFGMCWPASGATEIWGFLGSSSFQNEAVCEYLTTGNWKHQKSHREARSLLVN